MTLLIAVILLMSAFKIGAVEPSLSPHENAQVQTIARVYLENKSPEARFKFLGKVAKYLEGHISSDSTRKKELDVFSHQALRATVLKWSMETILALPMPSRPDFDPEGNLKAIYDVFSTDTQEERLEKQAIGRKLLEYHFEVPRASLDSKELSTLLDYLKIGGRGNADEVVKGIARWFLKLPPKVVTRDIVRTAEIMGILGPHLLWAERQEWLSQLSKEDIPEQDPEFPQGARQHPRVINPSWGAFLPLTSQDFAVLTHYLGPETGLHFAEQLVLRRLKQGGPEATKELTTLAGFITAPKSYFFNTEEKKRSFVRGMLDGIDGVPGKDPMQWVAIPLLLYAYRSQQTDWLKAVRDELIEFDRASRSQGRPGLESFDPVASLAASFSASTPGDNLSENGFSQFVEKVVKDIPELLEPIEKHIEREKRNPLLNRRDGFIIPEHILESLRRTKKLQVQQVLGKAHRRKRCALCLGELGGG